MESSDQKRRFPPPWSVVEKDDCFVVKDANGMDVAWVHHRDDLIKHQWDKYWLRLSSDEARRIAKGIARLPEFLMRAPGFDTNACRDHRWNSQRPYNVALEGSYIAAYKDWIKALCHYNGIPFDPTGMRIDAGSEWFVYEFARQIDAIMFWDQFQGRWLRYGNFFYPDRPKEIPKMKFPPGWKDPRPRDVR